MLFNTYALALDPETVTIMWQTPLLGMAMVFAVLSILWGVLALMKFIMVGKSPKPKKPEPVAASAPAAAVEETAEESEVFVQETDDGELVAVIAAAIAAYRAGEGISEEYAGGFRVVSFRRANNTRAWNAKK